MASIPVVYTAPERVAPREPLPLRKKLLFVSIVGMVGCLAIEATARLVVPAPLDWREHPSKILQYDPVRGWCLRPNADDFTVDKPVHVNAAGFRDRDFSVARAAGVDRIACVGDSYTYGWGVRLDESYPKQLERKLNDDKIATEVLNFGVFGYNAEQVLQTLRSCAAPYKPDLVLYGFYWDDLLPVRTELLDKHTFEAHLGHDSGCSWARRALRNSRALFFAVDRARAVEASIAPPRTRFYECFRSILAGEDDAIMDLWDGEGREICNMRDAAAKVGARFAVVLWPLEGQVLTDVPTCHFQSTARRICAAAGVPLIDMLEPLKSVQRDGLMPYLPFEQHPTPEAYRRCAEKIAAAVEAQGLLPSTPLRSSPASLATHR